MALTFASLRSLLLRPARLAPSTATVLTPPNDLQQNDLSRGQRMTLRIFPQPPKLDVVNMPEKHRLSILPKMPSNIAGTRPHRPGRELYRMRGEERVHNELLLGQFAIVAIHGGCLSFAHTEMLRNGIGRKLTAGKNFAIWRVDPPYHAVTLKGPGKKLGGGKASISHYVTPIKAGRVIVEVAGEFLWEEVRPWLTSFANKMPFEAIAVNQDLLDRLNKEERRLEETNENPYTFEWLVRNNMFDCHNKLSPLDKKWFGRFVYRDRHLNKKWNLVRQSRYHKR